MRATVGPSVDLLYTNNDGDHAVVPAAIVGLGTVGRIESIMLLPLIIPVVAITKRLPTNTKSATSKNHHNAYNAYHECVYPST